jgi:hypothetical protein
MFTLDHVVPWGRSFDEYQRMFALTDDDLQLRIVGCGDGPASVNAEATRLGSTVVSCDPIYRYGVEELRQRIASTYEQILEQTRRNESEFVWSTIHSVDELGRVRMAAMNEFLRVLSLSLEQRQAILVVEASGKDRKRPVSFSSVPMPKPCSPVSNPCCAGCRSAERTRRTPSRQAGIESARSSYAETVKPFSE